MSLIKSSRQERKAVGFLDPNPMSSTQIQASKEAMEEVENNLTKALSHFINTRKEYIMFPYNYISEAKTSH
ncbi:hypothetical protein ACP4OV_001940 [Aristida adscensionis]